MTFTEAAVEVLRLVGRPLHYKKITEVAIAKNLLSHVGKAPDMTMSSRLATMVKKDRGDEPIIKVKPGVFGLREFSAEVLALADADGEIDIAALPDVELPPEEEAVEEIAEAPTEKRARPALPGADVFPEEEDDDEPILAHIDEPAQEDKGGDERGGRGRRRRRRGRKGNEEGPSVEEPRARRSEGRQESRPKRSREPERLDMSRAPEDGELLGQDLADAVFAVLESQRAEPLPYARVAELLIRKGRLSGSPAALAPTLAAAVRADGLRRSAEGARFRFVDGRVALAEWYLPSDAARFQRDARRTAEAQRDVVHRAFLRKVGDLPTASFAELMATWLNAEGISALRAVRRPGSSGVELHLAGTLRRGQEEVRVAILMLRDGRDLRAERVVEVRGALHHYGQASTAWIITTGRADGQAREEVAVAGAPPVVLFDGRGLAAAMEARGVGLHRVALPLAAIDLELLDALRGEPEDLLDRGRGRDRERERDEREEDERGGRGKRRRKSRRDREETAEEHEGLDEAVSEREPAESNGEPTEATEESEGESPEDAPRRRRRRRRGGRRRGEETAENGTLEEGEAASTDEGAAAEENGEASDDGLTDEDTRAGAEADDSDYDAGDDSDGYYSNDYGSEDDSNSDDDQTDDDSDSDDDESDDDDESHSDDDDDSDDDDSDDDDSDDDDSDDDDESHSDDDDDSDDDDSDDEHENESDDGDTDDDSDDDSNGNEAETLGSDDESGSARDEPAER